MLDGVVLYCICHYATSDLMTMHDIMLYLLMLLYNIRYMLYHNIFEHNMFVIYCLNILTLILHLVMFFFVLKIHNILHYTIMHNIIIQHICYCLALHYNILNKIVWYVIILYCTLLHYVIVYHAIVYYVIII